MGRIRQHPECCAFLRKLKRGDESALTDEQHTADIWPTIETMQESFLLLQEVSTSWGKNTATLTDGITQGAMKPLI